MMVELVVYESMKANLIERTEKAEALADDLENQIAELTAGLDDAQGRVSELEGALKKAAVLDVGRPLPRDRDEAEFIEAFIKGQDDARRYVKLIARQALADDGTALKEPTP